MEFIEEIADHANIDTASFETLDTQPEEFSEGEFTDINEASGCDEKYKAVPEEVAPAKSTHYRNSWRYFMTLKKQRKKCWKLIQT